MPYEILQYIAQNWMIAIKLTLPSLNSYFCGLVQAKNFRNAPIGKRSVYFASITTYYLCVQLVSKLPIQLILSWNFDLIRETHISHIRCTSKLHIAENIVEIQVEFDMRDAEKLSDRKGAAHAILLVYFRLVLLVINTNKCVSVCVRVWNML